MDRRSFLVESTLGAAGLAAQPAYAQYFDDAWLKTVPQRPIAPADIESAVEKLRKQLHAQFDAAYVENVIVPHFLVSVYDGQRPVLPMIGVELTKENALPYDLWCLLSETWKPDPGQGVTVFLQGLEKRGPHNERKRIYISALDLYRPMYGDKVVQFFEQLLSDANVGKPLMRPYLDSYFDLYWDLHLGVKGDAVPAHAREICYAFNTVLAYRDVTQKIVYENYLAVRSHLTFLKEWIDDRLADLTNGTTPNPEKTFAHYWIKNGGEGENFAHKDVVFEVFHNFVALSQWGNTMYNIMLKLAKDTGDPDARAWFKKTMEGSPDDADGKPFTPLERFVMELFRVITPNGGSISALTEVRTPPYERHGYVATPHASTSFDPVQWNDPDSFNLDRYNEAPTSHDIDDTKCGQMGFSRCPFEQTSFAVKDGRKASIHNSGSERPAASLTVRRRPCATMQALRRSDLAIGAALASSSPFRYSKISCGRSGRAGSSSRS
jgi:hypothetical protein